VLRGHEKALRDLLEGIGGAIKQNPYFRFDALESVHFLRWVVLEARSPSAPARLAFESNYDGTPEEHLAELFSVAPAGMQAIYTHCDGYPAAADTRSGSSPARSIEYLLAHTVPYQAFYVGVPGLSAKRIKAEAALRAAVEMYLSAAHPNGGSPPRSLEVYRGALGEVRRRPEFESLLREPDAPFSFHPTRLALAGAVAAGAVPVLVPALFLIRMKEWLDSPAEEHVISDGALDLMAREDLQVQNQLTHVVPIRAGRLRRFSLKAVLAAINFFSHELFNRGNLGGISSIHFARWVFVEEDQTVVFFSNYDGSWASYLGDFIDRAHVGLTSIWSNTQGFPKTYFLIFKGATDEEKFKAWTRAYQVPTQLWFSAYPDLTVPNILNNRRIASGLQKPIKTERGARQWLARF